MVDTTTVFRQVTVEETVNEYFQQDYRTMHIQNHHAHTLTSVLGDKVISHGLWSPFSLYNTV